MILKTQLQNRARNHLRVTGEKSPDDVLELLSDKEIGRERQRGADDASVHLVQVFAVEWRESKDHFIADKRAGVSVA